MIKQGIFSFSIGSGSYPDKMTLGGYDLETYARGPIVWHQINPNLRWWVVNATSFGYSDGFEDKLENYVVHVDTGTSYLLISESMFNLLKRELHDYLRCETLGRRLKVVYCQKVSGDTEISKKL